jgi:hypothetical protein
MTLFYMLNLQAWPIPASNWWRLLGVECRNGDKGFNVEDRLLTYSSIPPDISDLPAGIVVSGLQ